MIDVRFLVDEENTGEFVCLHQADMPFIPVVGNYIKLFIDNDFHLIEIEDIRYVFDTYGNFSHIDAYLGEF